MKKIIMLLLCAICSIATYAQKMTEVVYLKNGSAIKGIIIEQVPNQSLKIQTSDGSIFVYNMSEVTKITKEVVASKASISSDDDTPAFTNGLKKGFRSIIEVGYQAKSRDYGENAISANYSAGFQINPYIFLGTGVGARYYTGAIDCDDHEKFAIPIYANFRSDFINYRVSPFVDAKIGYSLYDITGLFASLSLGCRYRIGNSFALSASTGYEMHSAESFDYNYEMMGEIFVKVGVEF